MYEIHFLSIYRLTGINGLPGDADVELLGQDRENLRLTLTNKKDLYFHHLQRSLAAGSMFLATLSGGLPGDSSKERFMTALARIKFADESPELHGVTLLVEVISQFDNVPLERFIIEDELGFGFGLEMVPRDNIQKQADDALNIALTALTITLPDYRTSTLRTMGSALWLMHPEKQIPIYDSHILISGSATTSGPLQEEEVVRAQEFARRLKADKKLQSVCRLLRISSEATSDNLRSFLSAWAGLEILLNKNFERHIRGLYIKLGSADSTASARFVQTIQSKMENRYSIVDKFIAMAANHSSLDAESDINQFMEAKKQRDSFYHAMKSNSSNLPTKATQHLLRKYLRLHISASDK